MTVYQNNQNLETLFGEPISVYTRAQAIEDGVLADVTSEAAEVGFRVPVAITAGLHVMIKEIPKSRSYQDYRGRLHDVLWMASLAARRSSSTGAMFYKLILHHGRKTYQTLKMHSGPGDNGEHVITIMLPHED